MRTNTVLVCVLICACGKPAAPPAPAPAVTAAPDLDRKLTRDECAASVDHAIAIFDREPDLASAARMMRDGRDGFIAQCEATATVRDRDCLMQAHDSRELGLCPMPGSR